MNTDKNKNARISVEAGLDEYKNWDDEKLSQVSGFIKKKSGERTPAQKLSNELQAINFKMENYLVSNPVDLDEFYTIKEFLDVYLKTLKLSFRKFAESIDTTDSNLQKYVVGERKFNPDLALKFGHFFHTSPELWLKIGVKNELMLLNKEKKRAKSYAKYDYRKVIGAH